MGYFTIFYVSFIKSSLTIKENYKDKRAQTKHDWIDRTLGPLINSRIVKKKITAEKTTPNIRLIYA